MSYKVDTCTFGTMHIIRPYTFIYFEIGLLKLHYFVINLLTNEHVFSVTLPARTKTPQHEKLWQPPLIYLGKDQIEIVRSPNNVASTAPLYTYFNYRLILSHFPKIYRL